MEFFQEHWVLGGLLLLVLTFVLNLTLRGYATSRRIPRDKELEWVLLRAAMARRKLGRARRLLTRFALARDAAKGYRIPDMVSRLRKASDDASDARSHLSAVLKKTSRLGCPIQIIRNLDASLVLAEEARAECRRLLSARVTVNSDFVAPTLEELAEIGNQCRHALRRAQEIVDGWANEARAAEQELARTVDPIILRSGGVLRNPFKRETTMEAGQAESALSLRFTVEDIERTLQCLEPVREVVDALDTVFRGNVQDHLAVLGRALDAIDKALGDAELPLPSGLVGGETPTEAAREPMSPGALAEIYTNLMRAEAFLIKIRSDPGSCRVEFD